MHLQYSSVLASGFDFGMDLDLSSLTGFGFVWKVDLHTTDQQYTCNNACNDFDVHCKHFGSIKV